MPTRYIQYNTWDFVFLGLVVIGGYLRAMSEIAKQATPICVEPSSLIIWQCKSAYWLEYFICLIAHSQSFEIYSYPISQDFSASFPLFHARYTLNRKKITVIACLFSFPQMYWIILLIHWTRFGGVIKDLMASHNISVILFSTALRLYIETCRRLKLAIIHFYAREISSIYILILKLPILYKNK